jgi:membrane-bound ClpP family serine protease
MELFSFFDHINALQAFFLVGGLLLAIVEIFYPGFGAPGIAGVIMLIAGVVLTAKTTFEAIIMIIVIIAILGLVLILVLRSASKGRLSRSLILSDTLKRDSGYASSEDLDSYIGKEGITITVLRPSGISVFGDVKLDVVSEGSFIPIDTKVKIVKVSGSRIVVRKI